MTFVKWDPFRDFANLDRGLGAVFSTAIRPNPSGKTNETWAPVVEIFERENDLVLRADLPGISREEIEIEVEDNMLTLSGERKQDIEPETGKTYRSERTYGAFKRSFSLAPTVDVSRIGATHKDGVLEIVLPKMEQAKPKRVAIAAV